MRAKVIINSKAGRGRSQQLRELIRKTLGSECESIESTTHAGHATMIARDACQNRFDTIVVVGGDGTINEVINGLVNTGVSLGVLPAGTTNVWALQMGIPAFNPVPGTEIGSFGQLPKTAQCTEQRNIPKDRFT